MAQQPSQLIEDVIGKGQMYYKLRETTAQLRIKSLRLEGR